MNKIKGELLDAWQQHMELPFEEGRQPQILAEYFDQLEESKENQALLKQWRAYCDPDEQTDADWEYLPKPQQGYLVPIMTGYKALTQVYEKGAVENTRDNKTDVCFVESVHSVGEWLSAHRMNSVEKLKESVWNYAYEENWYLCKQNVDNQNNESQSHLTEDDEDIYS
jgi:CRISPR-associated protein Csy2